MADAQKANSTERFSNRVENYIKYRPGYPVEVIDFLIESCGLTADSKIADIGSGTGIFSSLLLDKGFKTYGVEPNTAMRTAAEGAFEQNSSFISVNGASENTTLPDCSVDLIVCAQAFHWFKPDETRKEFKRILKDGTKQAALIWNNRLTQIDEFSKAYEKLLDDKAIDYREVNHQHLKGVNFEQFFKHKQYTLTKFNNSQVFDFEGLAGRSFSSSYVPPEHTSEGVEFATLLRNIFDKYNTGGKVMIFYETEVYLGMV